MRQTRTSGHENLFLYLSTPGNSPAGYKEFPGMLCLGEEGFVGLANDICLWYSDVFGGGSFPTGICIAAIDNLRNSDYSISVNRHFT